MKCCGKDMLLGWDGDRKVLGCRACGKLKPATIGSVGEKSLESVLTAQSSYNRSPGQLEGNDEGSEAEQSFISKWVDLHPDLEAVREYKPCLHREWRIDFCWPDSKVAVEVEGYGHQRDNRYKSDVEKYNFLAYDGWKLFRATKAMIQSEDDRFFRMLSDAILSNERTK